MDHGIPGRHGIPWWYCAVYFAHWSNGGKGGHTVVKMWLMRDSVPCTKEECFNGKGEMRYNTEAQYVNY